MFKNVSVNQFKLFTLIIQDQSIMTKCLDNVTLLNFQKFFGLRITVLHQGIVWGVNTP